MKKIAKYSGLLLLILVVSGAIYTSYVVYHARRYIRQTITPDLKASQWRHPNGKPAPFELRHDHLSKRQREILLKVQDPGFYDHHGIDLSTPGAGLTTLTQAIVKKLYFENFKSGVAKIKQSLIARFVVDGLISKEDQITLFINMAYFGQIHGKPVMGLESAANAFYQTSIKDLPEEKYISLVAMLVMPRTFHILEHPQWNQERTRRIIALVKGDYQPKGLMDQFYGVLPQEVIEAGLPLFSYFGDRYKE